MGHYAKVVDGKVVDIKVAKADYMETFVDDTPGEWVKTSYNTHCGVHNGGKIPLRKNYAGIGYTYDKDRDAFIPPKPWESWTLNEETCQWDPPVPYPEIKNGELYYWDETAQNWTLEPIE